jgi:hypothetical protein
MVRLGIVDFDSSHSVEFTKRLNHVDVPEEQWVEGAQVVMGWPGTSAITDPQIIAERTEILRGYGVEMVDEPTEMIGKVDGVLIESVDGSVHWERARPFLEAGMPMFVDKPFTCSLSEAQAFARFAIRQGVPVFSSSSLRYALEVQQVQAERDRIGRVLSAEAFSPASLHPRNPGLFHYGIHAVETLYALMGPGCEAVRCVSTPGADVVVGRWRDGRLGIVHGRRQGPHVYGFVAFCEKAVRHHLIDARFIYRELLKRVVEMFQTGRAPLPLSETVEIVGFMEAALRSAEMGGAEVPVGGISSPPDA